MLDTLILIGASTGGPGHINKILQNLPKEFPSSIIIAQHMSPVFINSFAKQLSTLTSHRVLAVQDEMLIEPSVIYVCSAECRLIERAGVLYFSRDENLTSLYTPNIDTLFLSAAALSKRLRRMGVILTGIGDDGTQGAQELYTSGGYCLFESEMSSVVYGMPRSAALHVPEAEVCSLEEIVEKIIKFGSAHVGMV